MKEKYGRLTIVRLSHRDNRSRKYYVCRCDCGTEKTVQAHLLSCGNTKSCGCLKREALASLRARLPDNGGVINHIVLQYRRHARNRELSFNLTRELFERLVRGRCYYCGISGSNLKITKNCRDGFRHNGIDRLDPSRGYEPDNVVTACKQCNIAKRSLSAEAFIGWAKRIVSHQDAMADQWGAIPCHASHSLPVGQSGSGAGG
jgi:hypothetical protein